MIPPISGSLLAEIVATFNKSLLSFTRIDIFCNLLTATLTALSIPLFKSIGFAPAVTFFNPAFTIACSNTILDVVPSPT